MSLRLLWLWCFSTFVFDDLDSFVAYCPDVLSLRRNFPGVFLQLGWVMGGRSQRNKAVLVPSCQGYMLAVWLITVDADLDHLAEVVFMEAFSFLSPFLFYPLWKKVTTCSPHLRSRETWSTSVNVEYLQKLFGNLLHKRVDSSPFICSFDRLYVSVWTHRVILWVVIQYCWVYFVAQVFPTLIIGSTFIWPLYLWHTLTVGSYFLKHFLTFWHYKLFQTHVFPVLVLELAVSPRNPGSVY